MRLRLWIDRTKHTDPGVSPRAGQHTEKIHHRPEAVRSCSLIRLGTLVLSMKWAALKMTYDRALICELAG